MKIRFGGYGRYQFLAGVSSSGVFVATIMRSQKDTSAGGFELRTPIFFQRARKIRLMPAICSHVFVNVYVVNLELNNSNLAQVEVS